MEGVMIMITKEDMRIAADALDLPALARIVREATFIGFLRLASWFAVGVLILAWLLGL
jgi:hypothetical protein